MLMHNGEINTIKGKVM
ncbi:hypothetical protein ACVNP0_02795 [Staphylococcus aureus]